MLRSIEFAFQTPWVLLLLIPAVVFPLLVGRRMRKGQTRRPADRAAEILRTVELALLVLILAGISLVSLTEKTETIVLVDGSDSMGESAAQAIRDAEKIRESAGKADTVRILHFGADVTEEAVRSDATDIASALTHAASSFSENVNRRVVLLSDGLSTDGETESALSLLEEGGIQLDAVSYYTRPSGIEVEAKSLSLPAEASDGQTCAAEVLIASSGSTIASLLLYDGENLIGQQNVVVQPGENVYSVSFTASGVGEHVYHVECAAQEEGIAQNNLCYAGMTVKSGIGVLLVDGTGSETATLAPMLRASGYAVDVVASKKMPETAAELNAYGLIVLMNVKNDDLPNGTADRLEAYISKNGGSVLTTGGENTYVYGGMKNTPLETFLPVTMSVEQVGSADPIALLLVMDITDSMTRGLETGTPIDMARRGAIKCLDALNPNDYAGIVTFSDTADLLVEMTSMEQKNDVIATVNRIETADAQHLTKFSDALRLACDTLKNFTLLKQKHVLFITDGSPSDRNAGFEATVKEMRANGITLSTIAVGNIVNVVSILENLSNIGGGRCYFVESAYDLPDIMSTDTVLLQVEYTVKQPIVPVIADYVFPIDDPAAVTQLFGHVRTSAKQQAKVALRAPDGYPIYAHWNYGQGKAASFMSDLGGSWSRSWFANPQGKQLVMNMIDELAKGERTKGIELSFVDGGRCGELIVTDDVFGADSIHAAITAPDGSQCTAVLSRTEDGCFQGVVPLEAVGCYTAQLSMLDASGNVLGEQTQLFAHNWSTEYERIGAADGENALRTLCASAGGVFSEDVHGILDRKAKQLRVSYDLALPLGIAVYICILADIILRRLQIGGKMRKD